MGKHEDSDTNILIAIHEPDMTNIYLAWQILDLDISWPFPAQRSAMILSQLAGSKGLQRWWSILWQDDRGWWTPPADSKGMDEGMMERWMKTSAICNIYIIYIYALYCILYQPVYQPPNIGWFDMFKMTIFFWRIQTTSSHSYPYRSYHQLYVLSIFFKNKVFK